MTSSTKPCTKCGETKRLDEFTPHPRTRDGTGGSCKRCNNEKTRQWKLNHPDDTRNMARRYHLKRKYGVTLEQYEALLNEQSGLCACCGEDRPGGRRNEMYHVDHDHSTGEIRGLLCQLCNNAIGALGDDLAGVLRAVAYLERAST